MEMKGMGGTEMDIQWYPGHMSKAKKKIAEDLKLVDMVIEVLDARIPISSRNPDLPQMLGKKPVLLVLNKSDLADPIYTKKWLSFYRQQGQEAVPFVGQKKQGIKELLAATARLAEPTMLALEAKGRKRRLARAMVVGVPNTGKSTLINALCPQAIAKTANRPGITRSNLWIKAGNSLELLDTPGVLWPKFADQQVGFHLAVIGSIGENALDVYSLACWLAKELMQKYPSSLVERYQLASLPEHPEELLEQIGRKRGMLLSGGIVNMEAATVLLLQEFRNGKLGRFTLEKPE